MTNNPGATPMKANNLVAKHMRQFNKASTQVDRKAAAKRGYSKHRKSWR